MLTRDIDLTDAILDLLDNCVDGVLRTVRTPSKSLPYSGYTVDVQFNEDQFAISDNCGGIPWKLRDYAFRLGRHPSAARVSAASVGVYGIGMKRAVFKIGRHTLIQTQHRKDAYDVEISPQWLDDEDNWTIPAHPSRSAMEEDGTTIIISELNIGVARSFQDPVFETDFMNKIATHYELILEKGLEVIVNGQVIAPRPMELRVEKAPRQGSAVRPYVYATTEDGVDVYLAVGFTRPFATDEELGDDAEPVKYTSRQAGWTIVCNDRAVVYCDRTELTGWGEAGVPLFHNQFNAISGIVEFRSNDPSKLPTTTTKRGLDASSRLYLRVKNRMREGLRMFTGFTNKWKGNDLAQRAQQRIRQAEALSLEALKASKSIPLRRVPGQQGSIHKPKLPLPERALPTHRRISFTRAIEDINEVSDYLFGSTDRKPHEVGEACFDRELRRARA